jgi:hypothetical protein
MSRAQRVVATLLPACRKLGFPLTLVAGLAGPPPSASQEAPRPNPRTFEGNWIGEWRDMPDEGRIVTAQISIGRDTQPYCNGRPFEPLAEGSAREGCIWSVRPIEGARYRFWGPDPVLRTSEYEVAVDGERLTLRHVPGGFLSHVGGVTDMRIMGPNLVRGRWSDGQQGGEVVWQRVRPQVLEVHITGDRKDVYNPARRAGRVETTYDEFWWGPQNNMRGNRPSFRIDLYGEGLWGHHVGWVDRIDLEGYRLQQIRGEVTGEVLGFTMEVRIWQQVRPGRAELLLNGEMIPFDLIIRDFPAVSTAAPTNVVVARPDEPADDHPAVIQPTREVPEIVVRAPDNGPALRELVRDQPFDIDLYLPESAMPRGDDGRIDSSRVPQTRIVALVLPANRGGTTLTLRYNGGTRWSTASPLTIKDGGGGSVTVLGFEFESVLGSTRAAGGVGSLKVGDGEYLTVRHGSAAAEVRVHDNSLRLAIALYREGFLLTEREMLDRLANGGYSSVEIKALNSGALADDVRDYILAHPYSADDLELMRRKLAYAGHALRIIDGDYYRHDLTRHEIAKAYAANIRYPLTIAQLAHMAGAGGQSQYGFEFTNEHERDFVAKTLADVEQLKIDRLMGLARDVAMGFYQWTIEESGAGDWVILAGIDPMTGKDATIQQKKDVLKKKVLNTIVNAAVSGTIREAQEGRGTAGDGSRRDRPGSAANNELGAGGAPAAGSRSAMAAEPPGAIPPVPDRPAALPGRTMAEPPVGFAPVPDRPPPLSGRTMAEPPGAIPPVPDRPAALPGRTMADPPGAIPPVPDRPAPFPGRTMAEPPGAIPPVPERPGALPGLARSEAPTAPLGGSPRRAGIEPPAAIPPTPDQPVALPNPSGDATIPMPPGAQPLAPPTIEPPRALQGLDAARAETRTQVGPALDPARAVREARASLDTEVPPGGGAAQARVVEYLRRTTPAPALRRWDETEAIIDRLIDDNPSLRQLNREQLSTYVGIRGGRIDATPAQLAAEAINMQGGRLTPRQLADATGLAAQQAEQVVQQGWRAMQMPDVDIHNPPGRGVSPSNTSRSATAPPPPPPSTPPAPPAPPGTSSRPADFRTEVVVPRQPTVGPGARDILERLPITNLDRGRADAYIAANAGRPGASDAQLAAEAIRAQGLLVTGKQLAEAAGLPSPLTGNEALRQAMQHLRLSPETRGALVAGAGGAAVPEDLAERWKVANDRRDVLRTAALEQERRALDERIAQAARLPPRPPNAPRATRALPDRYLVPGDTDYLDQIMGATPFRPSQVHVEARKVNALVRDMLGIEALPRSIVESPVRIGPGLLIEDGHNRLVAATIVSARTGRPLFQGWGTNGILPDPGTALPQGVRQERGAGWRLRVDP